MDASQLSGATALATLRSAVAGRHSLPREGTVPPYRGEMKRILLSVPHMSGNERAFVDEAFEQNWLSTIGPNLAAFEEEFSARIGLPAVALASGTAAMHLGLRLLGVGPGDEVICPTLTFAATSSR